MGEANPRDTPKRRVFGLVTGLDTLISAGKVEQLSKTRFRLLAPFSELPTVLKEQLSDVEFKDESVILHFRMWHTRTTGLA